MGHACWCRCGKGGLEEQREQGGAKDNLLGTIPVGKKSFSPLFLRCFSLKKEDEKLFKFVLCFYGVSGTR